jgi:RHS repeat-associated protein
VYQARVVGAMSYLGDRMTKPYRWSFETLTPDPPQVTKTDPRAGEELVPPDTAITVFFDRAILVGSTGDSTNEFLALEGPNGPVKGYVEWLKGDEDQEAATSTGLADLLGQNSYDSAGRYQGYRGLRFRPLAGLQPGATYEATVRGVENLYGVPMAGPYTWNFTVDPQGQILTIPAPEVRKYYYHNGQRVAMRQIGLDGSDVLYLIVGDHLGTTSLVLDAEGVKVAESRHFPYGGERWRWPEDGNFPTDYRFTGQRWEQPLGIYAMGARWYDPALGRWLSADTLVPEPGNPQAFNRYSYVLGNPLGYVDPSGNRHWKTNHWIWKTSLDVVSAVRWAHGREDVKQNVHFIASFAREEHQLIVAASIAHQASDVWERPFGTNGEERLLRFFRPDMSVGIAQLRPGEIEFYSPGMTGHDLQDPRIGVFVMADKIEFVDQYIQQSAGERDRSLSQTDRFMLIAIAQNGGNVGAATRPIDYFFEDAGGGWRQMFLHKPGWQETLRLVVLQIEWLLAQGWELPEGVNLEEMKETAFTDY